MGEYTEYINHLKARYRNNIVSYDIDSPRVSVILPVYNAENSIEKSLSSLINQTEPNIEITIDKNKPSRKVLKENNSMYEKENSESLKPLIISKEETLNVLLETNKSITRYGDGEFTLINGYGLGF